MGVIRAGRIFRIAVGRPPRAQTSRRRKAGRLARLALARAPGVVNGCNLVRRQGAVINTGFVEAPEKGVRETASGPPPNIQIISGLRREASECLRSDNDPITKKPSHPAGFVIG